MLLSNVDGGDYDIYDAYFFAQVWGMLLTGSVVACRVNINETPPRDNQFVKFNEILGTLQHPFEARFAGGPGTLDNDGHFEWKEPIVFTSLIPDKLSAVQLPASLVPLECGSTKGFTTFLHIMAGETGVARWPYGSQDVWLLKLVDKAIGQWAIHFPYIHRSSVGNYELVAS